MINDADLRRDISAYVQRLAGAAVDDDEPLISSQLLESIAAVHLISYIERTFDVTIDDEQLVLANFDSVTAIVTVISRLRRSQQSSH